MKRLLGNWIGCAVMAMVGTPGLLQGQSAEQEVRDRVAAWCAAFVEGEAGKMRDFYLDDANIELVFSTGDRCTGIGDLMLIYEESFQASTFTKAGFDDLAVIVAGSSGFATGRFTCETRTRDREDRWRIVCRTSLSLARLDDEWKIIGEHSSPIEGTERLQRIGQ